MAYSLYTDRNENFECDVAVKNASLKNSMARLIVKSDDINLLFEGTIRNGHCVIPISRMKGLLEENTRGQMKLEIIVDDTYFSPWQDQFIVEEHTSVKVQVHEQKRQKPQMQIVTENKSEISQKPQEIIPPEHQLHYLFERFGIERKSLSSQKHDVATIIKEYFSANPELSKDSKKYIQKAMLLLK